MNKLMMILSMLVSNAYVMEKDFVENNNLGLYSPSAPVFYPEITSLDQDKFQLFSEILTKDSYAQWLKTVESTADILEAFRDRGLIVTFLKKNQIEREHLLIKILEICTERRTAAYMKVLRKTLRCFSESDAVFLKEVIKKFEVNPRTEYYDLFWKSAEKRFLMTLIEECYGLWELFIPDLHSKDYEVIFYNLLTDAVRTIVHFPFISHFKSKETYDSLLGRLSEFLDRSLGLKILELGEVGFFLRGNTTFLFEALKNNKTLKKLILNSFSTDTTALSQMFMKNNTLSCLELNHSKISDKDFSIVAKGLAVTTGLETLSLTGNYLGKNVNTIKDFIRLNTPLKNLILQKNAFTDVGVKNICEALKDNTNLRFLDLKDNKGITKEGFRTLADYLLGHSRTIDIKY